MNDNAAADNDMDTAPSSSPTSAKPDPLAVFISGGAFSRGAPAVSAAASGANGRDSASARAATPTATMPDPLAAFTSGGAFSRGAPAVSAAASGVNGSDSASARAAPTAAMPDPLAAFISGGAFSRGAPTVSAAAAAAAAMSAARLAPIAASMRAPDPFGDGDDGGRFCGPAPPKKEHLFDLAGLACLCCAPEGDMEMSNPALAKMMGIKGKLGGGGGGRGQFDF